MITIDEFKKLDIKVAKIEHVKDHPNADKLYIITINLGSEKKDIVAGIRSFYKPEELINKNVVVINNLEPTIIRGVSSNAMLLACQDNATLSVITTDRDIQAGSQVR